jgi:non-specific serine/threonine protein kinase
VNVSNSSAAHREPLPHHNLPSEVAGFIGREHEIAEVEALLGAARMLTLTGAGGSGKTRLALRVGTRHVPNSPDGVWLVELASVTDPSAVPRAVAAALGVRGSSGRPLTTTLAGALASRRLLLVLDNCEHVVGAAARVVETLLAACPDLRVMATSREPLRVSGETVWRVPPLKLPRSGVQTSDSVRDVEAVALFVQRASARSASFTLTDTNAASVAAICCRLDGLPLAIELAAAQTEALSPAQLAARLDSALHLLEAGPRTVSRQQTLRATLDWSYALLTPEEQIVFCRLSVFAGDFSMEAVEDICDGGLVQRTGVVSRLSALVAKSLVESRTAGQGARYRLLEPVRQYAAEKLEASGEAEVYAGRHARYFLDLGESAEWVLMSAQRSPLMEVLAAEWDNLRTALDWSRRSPSLDDREAGLRAAGSLTFYWTLRGEVSEGLEWLDSMLERAVDCNPGARARALYGAAELGWLAGQVAIARARAEEAIAIFRELGDQRRLAYALQSLPMSVDHPAAQQSVAESFQIFEEIGDEWGRAMAFTAANLFELLNTGDPAGRGRAQLEESLDLWRALGDRWGLAQSLNILADLERNAGDDARATARYEEALAALRETDLTGTVPSLLHNLGRLALRRKDLRQAFRYFRESLKLFRDQGDQRGMADCLDGLAGVLGGMGQPERAARLFGAAEVARESVGVTLWPGNAADYELNLSLVRDALGEDELQAAWNLGRTGPLHETVAELLAGEHYAGRTANLDLSPREQEVASLVAQGLTNRQIGAQLFITEGTARLHVKHILQKLGFTSRVQIAAYAVERGLPAERRAE